MANLLDVMAGREGIVCAVGAGGKKTTLYALAAAHPGRVAFTTTVFTERFPSHLNACELIDEHTDWPGLLATTRSHRRVAYARPSEKPGRVGGIDPELIETCHRAGGFDVTLVKADGARMRAIKAPAEHEPVLPAGTTTVLCLVSAAAIGKPLDDNSAHRPDRLAAVTGVAPGAAITSEAVGDLLAAEAGLLRGIPADARAIAVINAVDNDEREALARAAARRALAGTQRLDRVVLTHHGDGNNPIVAVIDRGSPSISP